LQIYVDHFIHSYCQWFACMQWLYFYNFYRFISKFCNAEIRYALFSTDCASQLSTVDVRHAGEWSTNSLDEIKQDSFTINSTSSYVVGIFIHACIHRTIVITFFWHEVSFVFTCPSSGACVTTRYHNLRGTLLRVTHSARSIVVVETAWVYTLRICLILRAIDSGTIILKTRAISCIIWAAC
jgi:hypothetical protein